MRHRLLLSVLLLAAVGGCASAPYGPLAGPLPSDTPPPIVENPMWVPAVDRELLWDQLVDAVDDHFKIEREDRVRLVGGVLTQGRIDTYPTPGSTLLEPWHGDSTPGFEKRQSTLQSIRRRAIVQVVPTGGGYLVGVNVMKELEDLMTPEHSTLGIASIRYDGTLVRNRVPRHIPSVTLGWIPMGRDQSLEQKMLSDIRARLTDVAPPERLPPVGF